jgi:methyl-accepting chemotaxis protein/methyl-accepting chemotaxis protein-1 (serine sensor receptor)
MGNDEASAASSTHANTLTVIWVLLFIAVFGGAAFLVVIVKGINRGLLSVVADLARGADEVATAARHVSKSSQLVAKGASKQAASLEETSASSQEISTMSSRSSENSAKATQVVRSSLKEFEDANSLLKHLIQAMSDITDASGRISRINKVIDEIAFQTNILALNAAVEAARAGAAGSGFAVVADEVRNLARRCSQAAKETAEIIDDSVVKSAAGKTKVDEVAEKIQVVSQSNGHLMNLIEEVSSGSKEQLRGVDQISTVLIQMQTVVQSTAAGAEEEAAAAEELTAQAEAMRSVSRNLTIMVAGVAA